LPSKILSFDELGVSSDDVLSVCKGTGLTLFCGPTGAGKSQLNHNLNKMYYLVLIAGLCNQSTLFLLDIYYLPY
jgi:ABC-type phosphate transport system ATPase subunit